MSVLKSILRRAAILTVVMIALAGTAHYRGWVDFGNLANSDDAKLVLAQIQDHMPFGKKTRSIVPATAMGLTNRLISSNIYQCWTVRSSSEFLLGIRLL